jgi:hypothetical protein
MSLGCTELAVVHSPNEGECNECGKTSKLELSSDLSNLPPFHPNCTCMLKLIDPQ